MDEDNYTAHVFAGLAALELGSYRNAKEHYKRAIAGQPAEQLAWKVREYCVLCVVCVRGGVQLLFSLGEKRSCLQASLLCFALSC